MHVETSKRHANHGDDDMPLPAPKRRPFFSRFILNILPWLLRSRECSLLIYLLACAALVSFYGLGLVFWVDGLGWSRFV